MRPRKLIPCVKLAAALTDYFGKAAGEQLLATMATTIENIERGQSPLDEVKKLLRMYGDDHFVYYKFLSENEFELTKFVSDTEIVCITQTLSGLTVSKLGVHYYGS